MKHVKEVDTPIRTSTKLDMDENDTNIDITKYWGIIGLFLYLTPSILDIMFCVCLCGNFQTCPKEFHVSAIKWISLIFACTIDLGLSYSKGNELNLIRYSDAGFIGCKVDKNSTNETCYFRIITSILG
jgi:hypothetical protein